MRLRKDRDLKSSRGRSAGVEDYVTSSSSHIYFRGGTLATLATSEAYGISWSLLPSRSVNGRILSVHAVWWCFGHMVTIYRAPNRAPSAYNHMVGQYRTV